MAYTPIELGSETSRIRAALVNSGRNNFVEADHKIASSSLSIILGDQAADTQAGQAAFLTAAATGARCFGKVTVSGRLDRPLLVDLPIGADSLSEAAAIFGAQETGPSSNRTVLIGDALQQGNNWSVQAFWNGWSAGVAPSKEAIALGESDCALAGIAAGGLAVGQAFLGEQGDPRAGRTIQAISLWTPELGEKGALEPGPSSKRVYLPTKLWLIGLGNLGQAYLWSLSMLPYPSPKDVLLFLQDDDLAKRENWGTSILVRRGHYDILKTRVAEEWATTKGFQVRRIDRRLDDHLIRSEYEPGLALAGLDHMPARRRLGGRGFDYIVDAGLGAMFSDYQKFRINVFDASKDPAQHFREVEDQTDQVSSELLKLPAYRELARSRGDSGCGAAMLSEKSVAVPFVSAVVGALAISQTIRLASGQAPHVALTGDVCELGTVRATLGAKPNRVTVPNVLAGS